MRDFRDAAGGEWTATIREEPGTDYKGRFHLLMVPRGGDERQGLALEDVRWNSERTARRTLETMSEVELRRRLRTARGRSAVIRG